MYEAVLAVLTILAGPAGPFWRAQDAPGKPPPPPAEIAFSQLTPDAVLPIGLERGAVAAAGALWLSRPEAGAVVRVDPATNALGPQLAIGPAPCGIIVAAFDSLWTILCGDRTLARIDEKSGGGFRPVAPRAAAADSPIAAAVGSVWMISGEKGVLSRIDPDTSAPVAEVYVAPHPVSLASGEDALWVTGDGDLLTKINPHTNEVVETIKVGPRPGRVVAGEGGVWTLNRGDGSVTRVDPKTGKVVATIPVGAAISAGDIAAGEGSIWISAAGVPIVRIDPRTNRAVQRFTGDGGGAIVAAFGAVWVAAGRNLTWRLDPRLVASMRPD